MLAPAVGLGRQGQFARFVGSRVLSAVSLQMTSVAVGWQVYALTRSTFMLGMVGLAQFAPVITLALVAGQVADRFDRRAVARVCQTVEACLAGLLALGSATGRIHTSLIMAAVAALSGARAFEYPAMAALLPSLVRKEEFPRAVAATASSVQAAIIVGPALGGLLYAFGPTVPYGTAACLFGLASVFSASIRRRAEAGARPEPATLRSAFLGVAFIRSRPAILGSISLDLFAVLLGGATALLPVYARDILRIGPWGLGALRAAPAAGAFVTSLVLAGRPLRRRVGAKMFAAVIVFGAATVVFAFSTAAALSFAALLVLGAADMVSVVIRQALVQLGTPDEMRGRVSAVNWIFIGASNQLGELESGLTAALFGTVPAVALGGVGTLLVAFLWMRLFPSLRRVDSFESLRA